MKLLRRSLIAIVTLAGVACEHAKAPPAADSTTVRPIGAVDSTTAPPNQGWDANAGPLLLVATDTPSKAMVVVPNSATAAAVLAAVPHPASATLFSRAGSVQLAELPSVADSGTCVSATLEAAPPPGPWNVGFIGGVVAPLPMDSIESIAPADSLTLVTWMNRLASALPNDSAGRFAGLPFVVRTLWQFTIPGGPRVVVANVTRQINQEATPLQEHAVLIAEQAAGDTSYTTAYAERSFGAEETIERQDVLAGALLGTNRNAALILSRDFGDAIAYGIIERGDDGKWRDRWSSARQHC